MGNVRDIAAQIATIYDEHKRLHDKLEDLKSQLRAVAPSAELPRRGGGVYIDVPLEGKTVSVSDGDVKQSLNPERLRERLDDDELFLRIVKVRAVELNLEEWLAALEEERVSEDLLLDCVDETVVQPTVRVTKLKRAD